MIWPESPFWDYSLSLYGHPDVEDVCLSLQRRRGLDINLLLFACWLASRGIELDHQAFAQAQDAVSAWQTEVVRPLRAVRRRLTIRLDHARPESLHGRWQDQVRKLRQEIVALELDGEHLTQLTLDSIAADQQPTQMPGVMLASLNLDCLQCLHDDDVDDLEILLGQAFPTATKKQLANALSRFQV